ncbi:MAG: methyltransferase domain-containing protein [Pirellulales bacterium]|nr:methyltransferase domain-containing protein [Planctomycetales bacterium]
MNHRRLRTHYLLGLASLVALAAATTAVAQSPATSPAKEDSVRPDINANFLAPDLDPQQWVNRFEVESREVFRSRAAIVAAVNLKSGERVADIGAGTGLFTLTFAEAVGPEGWVFAVEIAPRFIERIGELAAQQGVTTISPVLGAEDNVRLPPESIDVAYVCDTYHHFEYPQSTLASIRRALRPGGRLVIVDFDRVPGESSDWILSHVRAGKQQVREEIEAADFEFVGESEIEGLQENYFITFKR